MTLKDILEASCSDVSIMKGIFPMITIFHTATRDCTNLLDQHTLNSEIEKMDIYDGRIRVWLIKEKSNVPLVDVTKCKDCNSYISGEDMKNDIVQNIKDCGESLINNAEKIAAGLPEYSARLSLTCYPDEKDEAIYINVSYDFIPELFLNKIKSGDYMN